MRTHADNTRQRARDVARRESSSAALSATSVSSFADNRPQALVQRRLQQQMQQGSQAGGAAQPAGNAVVQRYRAIDLDEAQNWEDVRRDFSAFRPQLIEQGVLGAEHYVMRYVQGPPVSSKLNVSEAGNMAINADGASQHTVFFLAADTLARSNAELAAANGDFELTSTGVKVVVSNHPASGVRKELEQVEATPVGDKGAEWARKLDTHCNIYYKNITKARDEFQEVFSTTAGENGNGEISADRRAALDRALAALQLKAGDAFEIKAFGENGPGLGWNEHYAGIVAVDGADQVTLENYNRDAEFGEAAINEATTKLGKNGQAIDDEVRRLRADLKNTWFWQKDARTRLNGKLNAALAQQAQWQSIMTKSTREQADTRHFRMYGPAASGQSFLDMWRGQMEKKQSKFSAAHAKRD